MNFSSKIVLSLGLFALRWWGVARGALVVLAGLVLVAASVYLSGSRLDDVRARAPEALRRAGFEVVGVEGSELGVVRRYGGAVRFVVRRADGPRLYVVAVSRWGSEYLLGDLSCVDCSCGGRYSDAR